MRNANYWIYPGLTTTGQIILQSKIMDKDKKEEHLRYSFETLLRMVAVEFDIKEDVITGESRKRDHISCRYVMYYLLKEKGWSDDRIAKHFPISRSAVSVGLKTFYDIYETDKRYRAVAERAIKACGYPDVQPREKFQ